MTDKIITAGWRVLETVQIGAAWRNHSRTIYVGKGMELWHELLVPWNPLQAMGEKVILHLASLPDTAPPDAAFCGMQEPYYGDNLIPVIVWKGEDALDAAMTWIEGGR